MDEIGCQTNSSKLCDGYEDFDAESILDEEIEEVGDLISGLDDERGSGQAFRNNDDEGDWWRFPAVDVVPGLIGFSFLDDIVGSEYSGSDALARLAQIDLFGESGALREASVQRYKEKRRTLLFKEDKVPKSEG
ncbi:Protein CHLOROPLAST IMPORT APPARATUS 2 [Bienertia sinuspersici]